MLSLYDRQLLIPDYLSDVIEGVQKRGLRIIYPKAESYTEALQFRANIPSIKKRRDDLCAKYMDKKRVLINYFLFLKLSYTREISMSSVKVSLSNKRARFYAILS